MLVVFAARMIARGLDVDEVVWHLEEIRERLVLLFVVDTIEFLHRGGRIGRAEAWIGALLGIKPILTMEAGEVVPVEKVRGSHRAFPRLMHLMRERVPVDRPVFAAVANAAAPDRAAELKELLRESYDVCELFDGAIGPIVGAHAGPGTVGAILFAPTDEELELLTSPE